MQLDYNRVVQDIVKLETVFVKHCAAQNHMFVHKYGAVSLTRAIILLIISIISSKANLLISTISCYFKAVASIIYVMPCLQWFCLQSLCNMDRQALNIMPPHRFNEIGSITTPIP